MVKNLTLKLLFIISTVLYVNAQDEIKVNLFSEKTNAEVDKAFRINLEIVGTSRNISIDEMGDLDPSISIRQSGAISNVSIINGTMTSSLAIAFDVKISKPGNYNIGPFTINIKNEKYKTNILDINVTTPTGQNVAADQPYNQSYNEGINNDNNNSYLLELNANKSEAYINEPIDIAVNFFMSFNAKSKNYQPLIFPTTTWIERYALEDNCMGKVKKNNKVYEKYGLEKERIFITKPGIYTVSPAIFDFYGIKPLTPFATYEPMTLKTKPLILKVNPLPDGAPKDFDGAVGTFQLTSNINSLKLNVKEPATLEITLSGDGNFQNIKDIGYKIDSFVEVYSSNSKLESDSNNNIKRKIWEILLVPSVYGKYELKIDDFHYFDINSKEYATIKGKEYTLNVEKNKKIETVKNALLQKDDAKTIQENVQMANFNNIHYLQLNLGKKNNLFTYELWFRFIIILYLIIFLLLVLFILFKYMIFNNLKKYYLSESKNAYKDFTHNINSLKKDINRLECQKCSDKISNILEKYFIKKFNIDSVAFTKKGIEKKLNNHLSEENIKYLKKIIIKLDMIRFGGEEISLENSKDLLHTIKDYVRKIEHNNIKNFS